MIYYACPGLWGAALRCFVLASSFARGRSVFWRAVQRAQFAPQAVPIVPPPLPGLPRPRGRAGIHRGGHLVAALSNEWVVRVIIHFGKSLLPGRWRGCLVRFCRKCAACCVE